MKLEIFTTKFNTDGNREKLIKSVMKKDYVPYITKCTDCERIIKACHYKDIAGVLRFNMNSPAQAMLFALQLVSRYTTIEFDMDSVTYDELQKCGALKMIIESIPVSEYQEYNTIMNMRIDDAITNETDVAAKLEDIKQAISAVYDSYINAIGQSASGDDSEN